VTKLTTDSQRLAEGEPIPKTWAQFVQSPKIGRPLPFMAASNARQMHLDSIYAHNHVVGQFARRRQWRFAFVTTIAPSGNRKQSRALARANSSNSENGAGWAIPSRPFTKPTLLHHQRPHHADRCKLTGAILAARFPRRQTQRRPLCPHEPSR
jgi:hypothetical protein